MLVRRFFAVTVVFFSLSPSFIYAQEGRVRDIRLSHADSLALQVKYDGNIVSLTKQLTARYTDEVLKARAIFIWITGHIAYDYKYYNRHADRGEDPVTFDCPSDDTLACIIKEKVWENEYINKALDKERAVCQGYAMLFKRMCDIAGLHAEVIPGYTRTEYYEVGTPGELDHAWNVVQLNGNYYLLDATWAAGFCLKDDNDKLTHFVKHFDDYYWLTPAEEFAKNHFPLDPKWVLIPRYTKETFSANPYYSPDDIGDIKVLAPASGLVKAKKGDTIRFKLKYAGYIRQLQINTNIFTNPDIYYHVFDCKRCFPRTVTDTLAIKKQQYIPFSRQDDTYDFVYVVRDYTLEYMDIMFDRRRILRFKVADKR